MPKENQRVALTKRLLKDAVMQLLSKKHIGDISVSELCQTAQINRTTFYRHYQTPHDVLMDLEMDFVDNFHKMSVISREPDGMRQYTICMCRFLRDNKERVKLFIANNMDQDFMNIFQNLADGFLCVRTVQYKGRLADTDTIRLVSSFFATGGYSLIRQWLMEEIPKTPTEIADLLLGSFNRDITIL